MAASDDAKELKGILGQIQKEMKGFYEYSKSSKDSLLGLVSAAEQFNNAQKEGTELSVEQLKIISERIEKEKRRQNLSRRYTRHFQQWIRRIVKTFRWNLYDEFHQGNYTSLYYPNQIELLELSKRIL